MAKNTGRNFRLGAISGRSQASNSRSGLWSKRSTSTGRFLDTKKSGGAFKGVRREN
ncbi:MAG TPA: hypothetical protein VNQ77_07070 [Frankiaceae bacterium]|nr:hypothetical protein [Frankiaceae bacterium]